MTNWLMTLPPESPSWNETNSTATRSLCGLRNSRRSLLRNPARADHPDVLIHQAAGGGRIAQLNEAGQLTVHLEDVLD
jgi:hypothetical protein